MGRKVPEPEPPASMEIMGMSLEEAAPFIAAAVLGLITILFLLGGGGGGSAKKFLSAETKNERKKAKLIKKTQISPDTINLRFELPSSSHVLGLPIGGCIKIFSPNVPGKKAGEFNGRPDQEDGEEEIERKYTPVPNPSPTDRGFFEMVIKVYYPNSQFCDGGKQSQYLDNMKVGDDLTFSGPLGMIEYKGKGLFTYGKKEMRKKKVGMMAGGSGITPMLQVVDAILNDPKDPTEVWLIFANKTEEDILVRDMLDALAEKHPTRFHLHYTLDKPPAGWKGSKGFITTDMIEKHLPGPGPDTVTLMCGPPPMIKFACKENLDKLGYAKADQLMF